MSVTAVPLQPLSKGTVAKLWIGILLVVLLAVGLAWIGTSRQQSEALEGGIRFRAYEEGTGDPLTPADVAVARLASVGPNGELLADPAPPGPISSEELPPPLRPAFLKMRKGGSYQVYVPVRQLLNGQPLPPGSRVSADDTIQFRFQIMDIQRGGVAQQRMQQLQQQQMMEQMMREQGGRPGGAAPGGAAPGGASPPPRPGTR